MISSSALLFAYTFDHAFMIAS